MPALPPTLGWVHSSQPSLLSAPHWPSLLLRVLWPCNILEICNSLTFPLDPQDPERCWFQGRTWPADSGLQRELFLKERQSLLRLKFPLATRLQESILQQKEDRVAQRSTLAKDALLQPLCVCLSHCQAIRREGLGPSLVPP